MHLPVFVKCHRILLQSLGHHLIVEHKRFFLAQRLVKQVEDIQQFSGIATTKAKERFRFLHSHLSVLENRVGLEGMVKEAQKVVLVKRLEHIHLRARQ